MRAEGSEPKASRKVPVEQELVEQAVPVAAPEPASVPEPANDSSSDSESELRTQLLNLRARKPAKKTWRDSAIHKRRQQRSLTVTNDSVHSDKHRDFLDKFIK